MFAFHRVGNEPLGDDPHFKEGNTE